MRNAPLYFSCSYPFFLVHFPPPLSISPSSAARFNLPRDKIVRFSKRPIRRSFRKGPRTSSRSRSPRKKGLSLSLLGRQVLSKILQAVYFVGFNNWAFFFFLDNEKDNWLDRSDHGFTSDKRNFQINKRYFAINEING